jgi:hypothetical protein
MSVARVKYFVDPNQVDNHNQPLKQGIAYYTEGITEKWQKPNTSIQQVQGNAYQSWCNGMVPPQGHFQEDNNPDWAVPANP